MDDPTTRDARLKLAKGFFDTVRLESGSSEHEIRNALSRCSYAFFHLSHVLLGRYRPHKITVREIMGRDTFLGDFLGQLLALRTEADYDPNVITRSYGGDLDRYRLRAAEVLDEAQKSFQRMLQETGV